MVVSISVYADQLGNFSGNDLHGILARIETITRSQQRTDLSQFFKRHTMHDRDELVSVQKFRQFLIGDASTFQTLQECGSHEYQADSGLRKTLVNLTQERKTQGNVLLTKPDRCPVRLNQIMQFSCRVLTVIPGMTKKQVVQFRFSSTQLHLGTYWGQCSNLFRSVDYWRRWRRPARP